MTPFHRKAVIVTGVAWTFVAMEILLVGFVVPIFDTLWNLNGRTLGLVTSAALAGSLVGSLTLGPARGSHRPAPDLPVLDPLVRALHGADRRRVGAVVGDDVPLPRRSRPRCDARRRPVDALGVPAAAAARALPRLPRLLVAGRAPARNRPRVHLPRPDVRPVRRQQLALPVPRRRVPGFSRLPGQTDLAREPVLPRAARPVEGGGRGAERDHGPPGGRGRAPRLPPEPRSSVRELVGGALRGRAFATGLIWIALNVSVLRPLPLAAVRAAGGEELHDRRLPAADPERALAVPRLRGRDLARRQDRAQADARVVPVPRRRSRPTPSQSRTPRPSTSRRSSSSASSTSAPGARSTRTRPSSSRRGCARAPSA